MLKKLWYGKPVRGASKKFPEISSLFSKPRPVTELLLFVALGGEAGAISQGRAVRLHLNILAKDPFDFS